MQETSKIEIEKVAENLHFADGLAWSRAGFLVLADLRQSKLYRMESDARPRLLKDNPGGCAGLTYDAQGRLYICEPAARRVSRMDRQGTVEPVAENFEGRKFNAPNDVVVRKDAHVYFTDPAFGSANDRRDLDFYGIYHVGPKNDMEAIAKWKTRPNGIAFSPDGKVLYVSDSDRHVVVAFDVDHAGAAANQRDLIENIAGVPGGIKTDADGRLYIAARGIAVYSPDGKLQRTFLEDQNATNCAFGGNDLESLFMSSRGNVFRVKLGVKGALQY